MASDRKMQSTTADENRWQLQDAKARFSELVDRAQSHGPQIVTRRGEEAVVVVSAREWNLRKPLDRPSLKELLLSDEARTDELVPKDRPLFKLRPPPDFSD